MMPDLPQPGLTPTEETTPPRPHGHGSSPSAFAGALPASASKPRRYFWPPSFPKSAPAIALHPMLFLALPEVRGRRWVEAEAAVGTRVPRLQPGERGGHRGYRRPEREDAVLAQSSPPRRKGLRPPTAFLDTRRPRRPPTHQNGADEVKPRKPSPATAPLSPQCGSVGRRRACHRPPRQSGATDNHPGAPITRRSAMGKPL